MLIRVGEAPGYVLTVAVLNFTNHIGHEKTYYTWNGWHDTCDFRKTVVFPVHVQQRYHSLALRYWNNYWDGTEIERIYSGTPFDSKH